MAIIERIDLDPKVYNGKPVIKGTRIPISVILEQIAQGESWDDLLKGYIVRTSLRVSAAN